MLLTHAQWAESNPAKQRLSAPHRSWRCVGLSAESPIFFVDLFWGPDSPDEAIRSVLVSSPEELIEIVMELGPERCRVFHLGLANRRREERPALTEVLRLRSHRAPGNAVKWYVYTDVEDQQHACISWSPDADETSVWEEELVFNTRPL
ncbi:hypothetical protein [Paraburkholderia caledonica]|uniref:DUF695 domain-containing protein n=1 Tax=Paraburkholderia caledonica TaxID=134536 RepID=A0AB73IIZ5_9BURK|nr:hypothetical protein [Paraburkholderia caledonica]